MSTPNLPLACPVRYPGGTLTVPPAAPSPCPRRHPHRAPGGTLTVPPAAPTVSVYDSAVAYCALARIPNTPTCAHLSLLGSLLWRLLRFYWAYWGVY